MSTDQLKNILIDRISEIEDEKFLQAIKTILDSNIASNSIFNVTDEQRIKIKNGITQLNNGQIISNEDLEKEEDAWLQE